MTGYVTGIIHITVHFDKTKGRETQRSLQPKNGSCNLQNEYIIGSLRLRAPDSPLTRIKTTLGISMNHSLT